MAVCIPKFAVDAFKQKLKDGTITPEKLDAMSSEERRTLFEDIVGKDNAKDVNALIESKLELQNQERGLVTAVHQILGDTHPAARGLLDRITRMDTLLKPEDLKSFKEDLVSKKLGTDVSLEEAQKISQLAKEAQDAKTVNPKLSGVSDEYLQKRNELNQYVASLKPTSAAGSIVKNLGIIARNNLLLNPATPLKTAIGTIQNTVLDAITRRISSASIGGENPELVKQANAEAWDTFRKTGNNTASMESMDDTHVLNKGENFKLPQGQSGASKVLGAIETGVRKTAEVSNKVAIDLEHNVPFTKFYQKSFFDMANISSSDMAKGESLKGEALKARAAEIFNDAVKIEPTTEEGKMIRSQAQRQAARITSTNDTWTSDLSVGTKNLLNKVGDRMAGGNGASGSKSKLPLGDILLPIAKIPANIIANGIDNAGAGLPKGVLDIFKGREKLQSADLETRQMGLQQFHDGVQHLARIAGTMGAAAFIASRFQKSDFRTDNYGAHFFRIGNTWINTEYLNIISPALAGFMKAKESGGSFANEVSQYAGGAIAGLKSAPGADEYMKLRDQLIAKGVGQGAWKYASDLFTSRSVPTFVQNLRKDRPWNRLFFGSTGVETDAQVKKDAAAAAAKAKASRVPKKTGKLF